MERNNAFLLKQMPVINTINEENAKEQKYLRQLRQSYRNKIQDTRRSYNSLTQRRSVDLRQTLDAPSLAKLIYSRHMQSRQHQMSLEKIMKELNLKSNDPKDKFYEYLLLPFSHRTKQHIKTLEFYLKEYAFVQAHPPQTHMQLCYNIVIKQGQHCKQSDIVLVENSIRIHNQFKQKGFKVDIADVIPKESYLCLDRIKYKEIVDRYSSDHFKQIQKFIAQLELFNDVDIELMNKISRAAETIFLSKGQHLYQVQNTADKIFVVFKGKLARKIIIEIQKSNMLPLQKQQVLTTNTIYEVEIEFTDRDVLGYLELLQDPPLNCRSQTIVCSENSTVIGISYQLIKQLRSANFKWFKKQREQKYPKNYQQLCNHYQQKMAFNKKVKLIAKSTLKGDKNKILALDNYKIDNIKYVRSNSLYKLRKSIF